MEQMDAVVGWIIVLALIAGAMVLISMHRQRTRANRQRRFRAMQEELEAFVTRAGEGLTPISTSLLLQKGEYGVLEEPTTPFETRAYRVYGGGGTRIKGIYIGGGVSESQQRLREIDTGTLTLTKRLVFDGTHENRSIRLSDLLSVNPWSDAVEVSSQRRAKSQIFRVSNPLIWTTIVESVVESVAAGKFTARPKSDQHGQR